MSNSLKYAFPGNRKGIITLSLSEKEGQLFLRVTDDGIGYDTASGIKGTGFGSQLIQLLTQQLEGRMTLIVDKGTEVYFEFHMGTAA
jgi:two-component sensor histidine kinase